MFVNVAVTKRRHAEDYLWRITVNDVTITGSTRLRPRDSRYLRSLLGLMLKEQRRRVPR